MKIIVISLLYWGLLSPICSGFVLPAGHSSSYSGCGRMMRTKTEGPVLRPNASNYVSQSFLRLEMSSSDSKFLFHRRNKMSHRIRTVTVLAKQQLKKFRLIVLYAFFMTWCRGTLAAEVSTTKAPMSTAISTVNTKTSGSNGAKIFKSSTIVAVAGTAHVVRSQLKKNSVAMTSNSTNLMLDAQLPMLEEELDAIEFKEQLDAIDGIATERLTNHKEDISQQDNLQVEVSKKRDETLLNEPASESKAKANENEVLSPIQMTQDASDAIQATKDLQAEWEYLEQEATNTVYPLQDPQHVQARMPLTDPIDQVKMATKYAAIESVEDRAFEILLNLGMIEETPPPVYMSKFDGVLNLNKQEDGRDGWRE